jgi:RND family efflux transporter MFP subunit
MAMTDTAIERPWRSASRPTLYIGAALLGVLVLAGGFLALRHAAPQPDGIKRTPALTVTRALPRRAVWPSAIQASGAIAPWQEASIGSQIGGYQLIDVRVNVGDHVKKGQVLARLNPALLQADAAQLQAGYDQAEANQKRYLSLQNAGATSEQSVLQAVTEARTTQAALAGKRLQLRYTDVTAPDDGVISARTATLGAVVSVGQELFRLIRQDRLEWRGELTASQIVQIAAGQRITLELPDGTGAVATVRQTAPSLDGQSRLGIVYADIATGSHARAGMFANGQVVLRETPALTVPAESVVIRDGRSYLLKLADGGTTPRVTLQAVTVGRRQGGEMEILQGVGERDVVVVQGAGFLNDGDIVRLAR